MLTQHYLSFIVDVLGDYRFTTEGNLMGTSHTRLGALDRVTSTTLIGGKGGTGPSSLHIALEGLMEYVNARWM